MKFYVNKAERPKPQRVFIRPVGGAALPGIVFYMPLNSKRYVPTSRNATVKEE